MGASVKDDVTWELLCVHTWTSMGSLHNCGIIGRLSMVGSIMYFSMCVCV